ncbi:hypothetical protein UlMin_045075 [Ulmus minor]
MEECRGTVCVTGGTGYVASWLIMRLLQHGYSVRATVRSHPGGNRDISYLTNLPKASEKLQIIEANLNQPESFNAAIEGCVSVFHLAHPMDMEGKESEEEVTRRALEGTLGILRACLYSKTIKRVVYTSSAVTVLFNGRSDLSVADETTWSDLDVCRNSKIANPSYLVSKTLVEKEALDFAEKNGLNLVSVVLPLVVGPFICPNIPASVYMSLAILFGIY